MYLSAKKISIQLKIIQGYLKKESNVSGISHDAHPNQKTPTANAKRDGLYESEIYEHRENKIIVTRTLRVSNIPNSKCPIRFRLEMQCSVG